MNSEKWKYYIVDFDGNFIDKNVIENWTIISGDKIIGVVLEEYVDGTLKIIGDPNFWEDNNIDLNKCIIEIL